MSAMFVLSTGCLLAQFQSPTQSPAQSPTESQAESQYRILPGNEDADGLPTSAARICLGVTGTDHCYTPPDYMKDSPFGLDPKAETIGRLNGQNLTLFTATFYGGGSGKLISFAMLIVWDGEFANLLPKVQLTEQSEYRIWRLPQFSSMPILVFADFVWDFDAHQTHFAPHHYQIRAFVFDAASRHYVERVHYTTAKKYPGLDAADAIHVLTPERQIILAKLRRARFVRPNHPSI